MVLVKLGNTDLDYISQKKVTASKKKAKGRIYSDYLYSGKEKFKLNFEMPYN